MNLKFKEVYYKCAECKYEEKPEYESPCDECLETPVREDSHTPICFKKKEKEK